MLIENTESYGIRKTSGGYVRSYNGEIEIETRVPGTGQVVESRREHNIIKIFSKEIIAHRLPHFKVWDPNADSGAGAWVAHSLDLDDFSPKYICFGASFDSEGQPLDSADTRYYVQDSVSGTYVNRTLEVGATFNGGLINPIPISEPNRPLKRIERIYFEPTYQPAGVPLLQDDVRAMNNVVVFETVLRKDEYNGFGLTGSDFFTITECVLVAGKELDSVGACECDPHDLFMEGGADGNSLPCTASGSATITLADSVTGQYLDVIREGDQIKLVSPGSGVDGGTLNQVSPYYLVISKVNGGRDIVLDRTPYDSSNTPIVGQVGAFKDGFKVFSHRILQTPYKKSRDFEMVVRWRIILG